MLTIKWYLAANGSTQVLDKNFPVYQGQYQNILLNIFVPTSLLAPNFTVYANEYQNVVTPYVAGTGVKVGMVVTNRDGSYIKSKDYFCRYIKTLVKDNVEYALFERKLPQEFTLYAAYGVSAAQMIANVVNVQYGQITSASATSTNSTLAPTVDVATLSSKVPAVSQNYTFTYHIYTSVAQGTTGWYLNSEYVHLSDYGITLANTASVADNDTIVLSVVAAEPTVLRVATSQVYPLDVLPSSRLLDDETLDASDLENIEAQLQSLQQSLAEKQNIEDNSLQTKNKTVPTAINENRQNIMANTGEIANNSADIADLQQTVEDLKGQLANGTDYLGTLIVAENLPTDAELLAFAKQQRGADYTLKNQDVVIVIVTHADATDENYKYTYNFFDAAWDYFKIPAMEKAKNGTFGIVQGTYGIDATYNVLVNIVDGTITDLYIKQSDGSYATINTLLGIISKNFEDIASGQSQVGFAKKAEQDGNGANIAVTYLTKALGATKQYVRDYALPNEFNDVSYFSADGYTETIPTTENEVQATVSVPTIANTPIFNQVEKAISTVKFELASKNGYTNKIYVASNKDTTVRFTLLTYAKIGGETQLIGSTQTDLVSLQADVITSVAIADNFALLGKNVLHFDDGDKIAQTLLVTATASDADRVITLYSGETYPSTFYLSTGTTTLVQGSLNDLTNISFPYGEPTVTYDTTDGIRVSGIFRFTAGTTDTDIPFEMEIPIVAENHLVADATTQNTHVIIKLDPEWEKTVQNEYLQSYESATVPSADQVLTLTNANFARTPIVGQFFRLLEVVNINDTYESTLQVLTVGDTTCTAKIMSFTDITSCKLTKVTEATTTQQAYVKNADGSQGMLDINNNATAQSIVLRDNAGRIYVKPGAEEGQAVNVKQMNSAIATGVEVGTSGLERTDNKVTAITGEGSDVQYPSTKAVVDYVAANAGTAYHVELTSPNGTLTKDQVDKLVADTDSYVLYTADGSTYKLCRNIKNSNALAYSVVVWEQEYRVMITLATYEWQYSKVELQNVADKTSMIGTGDTISYPNTKAVYDADQATLTAAKSYADTAIANAITTALNTPV